MTEHQEKIETNKQEYQTHSKQKSLTQAIIFSSLVISGIGLFSIISAFNVDWYLPTLSYGTVVYLAWQRFFNI